MQVRKTSYWAKKNANFSEKRKVVDLIVVPYKRLIF